MRWTFLLFLIYSLHVHTMHAFCAEYDGIFQDLVCHDKAFQLCERVELCKLILEKMSDDFYMPTLTQIADKMWQSSLPKMAAASTKNAKKRCATQTGFYQCMFVCLGWLCLLGPLAKRSCVAAACSNWCLTNDQQQSQGTDM